MSVSDSRNDSERRQLSTGISAALLPMLGLVLAVAGWWLATALFNIQTLLVPAPPDVVEAFLELPSYLMSHTWVTVSETILGFGLAIVIGLVIALAIASSRVVERMFYPMLVALNAVPKIAFGPLLVLWMGFERQPKIAMVLLICFFPIVISSAYGLTSTPTELIEYARSLDTARWRVFLKVRFPYALPQIFVGLKTAVALAVIGAVVGEFSGGDDGLGFVIQAAGSAADTPLAFAAIVLLGGVSIILFYFLVGVERMLLPWAREITSTR